jgi:hypothetical protein
MSEFEGLLHVARSDVPECVAAAYVDLATGMLLGATTAGSHSLETLELVGAAATDLFLGPSGGAIESLFSPLLEEEQEQKEQEEEQHEFDEILVLSTEFVHFLVRAREHPRRALVIVCRKEVNMGMTMSRARLALAAIEAAA